MFNNNRNKTLQKNNPQYNPNNNKKQASNPTNKHNKKVRSKVIPSCKTYFPSLKFYLFFQ